MGNINQNQEYYQLVNLNDTLSQALLKNGVPQGIHYLKDIASVKVSMFKYKGIEAIPNLTSEILETIILFNNFLCFYNHPALGIILCRWITTAPFNEYLRPKFVNLLAINGTSIATNVPYDDIILVRDNSMDIIPFITMIEYIRKIEKCDTAVFKALNVATLPLLVAGTKKLANQLNVIAKKLDAPEAFIVGDDQLLDQIKAFDIDVKVNPLDIYELKTKYKNECIASLGIYTVEQKKERKIVSEVSSQNEYTDSIYMDMRNIRKKFVEDLNSKFGLSIELVETKREIAEQHIKDAAEMQPAQGGTENDTPNT